VDAHVQKCARVGGLVFAWMGSMIYSNRKNTEPYVTRDGSLIRELMHPSIHANRSQSLAEATIAPGQRTSTHRHIQSEEIYYIQQGKGTMFVGDESREVGVGDSVAIPAGTFHSILNTGDSDLIVLCACSPPYAHDDTEIRNIY
jgi:mannose-6-phosphate isomerase-like protein (cupin superfamily)